MIVLDCETSGLDSRTHSLLSIGALDFSNPANTFYQECRMFDGALADPEALAVNGFTLEQLSDSSKPSLHEMVSAFFVWTHGIEDRLLAGHNTFFDRDFLYTTCERYHLPWDLGHRLIDLQSVCWAHMVSHGYPLPNRTGKLGLTSTMVLAYTGLPPEPRPHHGLVGAQMEAEALSRLVHGRPLLDEYKHYPVPVHF